MRPQENAMSIEQLLRQSSLFQSLDDVQLQRVAALCRKEKHPAEKVMFEREDRLQDLFLIEKGSVRLTMDVRLWNSSPTLRTVVMILVEGDALGWSSLVEPNLATLSAHTREPCTLVGINAAELRTVMDEDPLIGYKVMHALASLIAGRLQATTVSIISQRATEVAHLPASAAW